MSMSYALIQPGAVISFTPRSILQGTSIDNVTVIATMQYYAARNFAPNIDDLHNQVYSEIHNSGAPISDDPSSYNYFAVVTNDAARKQLVFGYPWVDPNSIQIVGSTTAIVTLSNVTPPQQQAVVDVISKLGIKVDRFKFTN